MFEADLFEIVTRLVWVLALAGAVLGIAWGAVRAAGDPGARYRVLIAAVAIVLLVPTFELVPESWRAGVPWMARPDVPVAVETPASKAALPRTLADEPESVSDHAALLEASRLRSRAAQSAGLAFDAGLADVTNPIDSTPDAKRSGVVALWPVVKSIATDPRVWLGVWALGVVLVLARLAFAVRWLAGAVQRGCPADEAWQNQAAGIARCLGVRRPVMVVRSEVAVTPMTWGWRRPVILIPAVGDGWSAERRRVVLLHELVHVRRGDWPVQVAALVMTALHWPNPLAWWALRRLSAERERSCDAAVVSHGTAPSLYANHLLEIARSLSRGPRPALALGMARTTELEGRVMSMLNLNGKKPGRSFAAVALVLSAGLAGAALAPQTVPPEKEEELAQIEAELAELEAELADRRSALRAERRELERAERAERADRAPEAHSRHDARPARPAGVVRTRPAPAALPSRPMRETAPELLLLPDAAPEPVSRSRYGIRQDGTLDHPLALHIDESRLDELLAGVPAIVDIRLIELHEHLAKIQADLQPHLIELEAIQSELEPIHVELAARQELLEPHQRELEVLSRKIEERHHRLQSAIERRHHVVRPNEAQPAGEWRHRVSSDRAHADMAAIAAELAAAAAEGDTDRIRDLQPALDRARALYEKARDAGARPAGVVGRRSDRGADVRADVDAEIEHEIQLHQVEIEKLHQEMDKIHQEMDGVHGDTEHLHQKMDGVHQEMDGVHGQMDGIQRKMESTHMQMERVFGEYRAKQIRGTLSRHGFEADEETTDKLCAVLAAACGQGLSFSRSDDTELVQITDPTRAYEAMQRALAAAEAERAVRIRDRSRAALDAALAAAAAEGEVLKFRLRMDE